jgi:dinuclear metal center YbgI/SA1388 family protein
MMMFTTQKLDSYFRGFLDIEGFKDADASMNGLQVDNDGSELGKIVFAVDACMEVFKRAADAGAGMVFVHHGLFWGKPISIEGSHRQRVKFLMDNNIALYVAHLPLDHHPRLGNNAVLADLLGIKDPEPFGIYHGRKVGYKGMLSQPLTIDEAARRVSYGGRPLGVFPFGKKENLSCAVVSGGAISGTMEALREGIDLYVTGETSHTVYHPALEGGLNIIAEGHYSTETWGVRRVMEECVNQLGIDAEFIDVPTGL